MDENFPLNAMVIDSFLSKVVNDFLTLLVSQGIKLGLFLKKLLKAEDDDPVSKSDVIEATSDYIDKRSNHQAAADVSKALICIGNNEVILNSVSRSPGRVEILSDIIQRHIEHHVSDLEVASSSYLKILQENQMLFNELLDLKGKIRIYCRVRPFLPGESKDQLTVEYIGENGSILIVNSLRQRFEKGPFLMVIMYASLHMAKPDQARHTPCMVYVCILLFTGILTIHVHGKELVSGSIFKGSLNLVDLAGSERVDKSKVQGDRLKEAQYINRSLSAFGDVISALAQKSTHIPYRNSKLTQILQNSLGGHAKTLMLVHISPEPDAIRETVSMLKFAERVALIELGAARSNKETGDLLELKEEITNLKLALEKKEAEVEQLRSITSSQKTKVLRFGMSPNLRPDAYQRPNDDTRSSEPFFGALCESRNSRRPNHAPASAKQRRSKFSSTLIGKEISAKLPEERAARPGKPRSPTAPVRRYLSGDKGALTTNKVKFDVVENQSMSKAVFPGKAHGSKSLVPVPDITSPDNNSGVHSDQVMKVN
ncbi:Kinesin-like protein 1 isoform 2 [Hibiscus syriacus]|uniref:Kinesin-like protein n=1 Tax=Hibiscus syriacus TaxID=106335 RepID=A0A6A2X721_HIBSY|nr:Kinesin-like protein 1 isoform 2 [Hibiscus syriacus]